MTTGTAIQLTGVGIGSPTLTVGEDSTGVALYVVTKSSTAQLLTASSGGLFAASSGASATFQGGLASVGDPFIGTGNGALTTNLDVIHLQNSATLTVNSVDQTSRHAALEVFSNGISGTATLSSTTGGVLILTDSSKATFQDALAKVAGADVASLTTSTDVIRLAKTSTLIVNGLNQNFPALFVIASNGAATVSFLNGVVLTMTDQAKATFAGAPGQPSLAYVTTSSATAPATLMTFTDVIGLTGKVALTVNGSGPALFVENTGSTNALLQTSGGLLTATGGAQATFAGTLATVDSHSGGGGSVINAGSTLIQASGGSTIAINGTGPAILVNQGASPQSSSLAGLLSNTGSTVTTGGTLASLQALASNPGGISPTQAIW